MHYISKNNLEDNFLLHENQFCVFFRFFSNDMNSKPNPHRDADFWVYDSFPIPSKVKSRWKVWIPIIGCNAKNSLHMVSGSHLHDISPVFENQSIQKHSPFSPDRPRPSIDKNYLKKVENQWIVPISNENKNYNAVLFHDKIVHKGVENKFKIPRISCEFTFITF